MGRGVGGGLHSSDAAENENGANSLLLVSADSTKVRRGTRESMRGAAVAARVYAADIMAVDLTERVQLVLVRKMSPAELWGRLRKIAWEVCASHVQITCSPNWVASRRVPSAFAVLLKESNVAETEPGTGKDREKM